jgi:Tol biopolymer transport system component
MNGKTKISLIISLAVLLLFSFPASADLNIDTTKILDLNVSDFSSPAWSPDGTAVAYIAHDSSNLDQIFTINTDGTGLKQVTIDPNRKWGVTWQKEGIFFFSFDAQGLESIYIIQPDGSGWKKLLDEMVRQGRAPWDRLPEVGRTSLNSVNQKVLFTSYDANGLEKIFEVNLDGTGNKQMINDTARQWSPSWSPDGNSFVYVSYGGENKEQLFTSSADGSNIKQITSDNIKKSDPNWGPGGILFVSLENESSISRKIVLINPDGTNRTIISGNGFEQISPRWSLDGTKILYEDIYQKENNKIVLLNLQKLVVPTVTIAAPTPTVIMTPQATPAITETPGKKPESTLEGVILTMLLFLGAIVILLVIILLASEKKK